MLSVGVRRLFRRDIHFLLLVRVRHECTPRTIVLNVLLLYSYVYEYSVYYVLVL